MSRWFSVRGARRGMKLSAFAVALWLSWAVGFTQSNTPVPPGTSHAAPPSSSPPCCQPVPST